MIKVKDLQDQIDMRTTPPFLLCRGCGAHWSAHRGDYFMADPNTIMRCFCSAKTKSGNDMPLILVDMETTYHVIKR